MLKFVDAQLLKARSDAKSLPALTMTAAELKYRLMQAVQLHMSNGDIVPVVIAGDVNAGPVLVGYASLTR